MLALVDQRSVDLVSEDARVIFLRQRHQLSEIVFLKDGAQWVERIGQQDGASTLLEGALDVCKIEGGLNLFAAGGFWQFQKRRVGRNRNHHWGIGPREVVQRQEKAPDYIADPENLPRVGAPAVARPIKVSHGVIKPGRLRRGGIAKGLGIHGALDCILDRRRSFKIGLCNPQRQYVIAVHRPLPGAAGL